MIAKQTRSIITSLPSKKSFEGLCTGCVSAFGPDFPVGVNKVGHPFEGVPRVRFGDCPVMVGNVGSVGMALVDAMVNVGIGIKLI